MADTEDPHPNVIGFPPSASYTPEQALASAGQFTLSEVMIIGVDSRDGTLMIRSSRMGRKDALWLLRLAEKYTVGED